MPRREATFWTQGWISYTYMKSGAGSRRAFAKLLMRPDQFEPPSIVRDWRNGKHAANSESAAYVETKVKGTAWLHDLPIVELLLSRRLSKPKIWSLLGPYVVEGPSGERTWCFPNDHQLSKEGRLLTLRSFDDSTGLRERGDICGLVAILGLLRLSEGNSGFARRYTYAKDLYRAVPSVAREPWLKPHVDVLLESIERVVNRIEISPLAFHVKWEVMQRQILDVDCTEDLILEFSLDDFERPCARPSHLLDFDFVLHRRQEAEREAERRAVKERYRARRTAMFHRLLSGLLIEDSGQD